MVSILVPKKWNLSKNIEKYIGVLILKIKPNCDFGFQ
jgi:hypothetical protein